MAAGILNLTIEQGATFSKRLTLKDSGGTPIDLTGRTFRGKIKAVAGSGTAIASFTFGLLNQITNTGQVDMSLTATETAAIPVDEQTFPDRVSKQYAYDVEMVNGASVERILQGVVDVSPEVTT